VKNQQGLCEYLKFSKHLILEDKGELLEVRLFQGLLIIPIFRLLRKKNLEKIDFSAYTSGSG